MNRTLDSRPIVRDTRHQRELTPTTSSESPRAASRPLSSWVRVTTGESQGYSGLGRVDRTAAAEADERIGLLFVDDAQERATVSDGTC